MTISLRVQLSLWLGLAILVIMFSTTFVAQQVTVWNIESSLDDALQKRANMVAAVISSDITTDEASYVQVMTELAKQEFAFVPLLLRLVSPSGKTIIEFGKVTDPIVRNLDYQLRFPDVIRGRFDSIILEGIETLRQPRLGERRLGKVIWPRCSTFERRVRQAMSLIWPLAARQFDRRHSSLESRVRFRDGSASISRRTNSMSPCVISRP